jgi:uncharacterized protein YecE (DUF72 family)
VHEARGGARQVRIGCSGWNYAHWREVVYPKGLPQRRWLEYYATLFDTVEVNNTFYRLPRVTSVANWVAQTPPGFAFAVKASRFLTHIKRLSDMGEPVRRFYACIDPLVRSPKLGPVLWQLPPTFRRDDERLLYALAALPEGRHAFEFRHESWFVEETYDALRRHGAALVIADRPEIRTFQARELTTDFTFVRFHHGGGDGNYSHRQLASWAARIEEWRREVDVFVYFNNDWEGFAVENGLWLKQRLRA